MVSALVLLPSDESAQNVIKNSQQYQSLDCEKVETQSFPDNGQYDIIIALECSIKDNEDSAFSLLKPCGRLHLCSPSKTLAFSLKIAGFTSTDNESFTKPAYELGSAVKVADKVWNIDEEMGDDDLINDEDLLDETDKAKPTEESLRVCATTKQRKACANCSCGLKEELESEEIAKIKENTQNAKSSCGNCYLGDAFRCAACPYRGLPAFKAGEKVTVDAGMDDL